MDGFEVCRRIQARADTRGSAVIAMTASHWPRAQTRILACGAWACLAKPLRAADLLAHLAAALRG